MSYKSKTFDEEPLVTRTNPRARLWDGNEGTSLWPQKNKARPESEESEETGDKLDEADAGEADAFVTRRLIPSSKKISTQSGKGWPTLKRGHALSFTGLLLFTAVTYFRPYELIPALSGFTSMAFWLAVLTLAVFIPTQLSVEGNLTYRPKEVSLILLLLLMGLLSIPFAIEPAEAFPAFVDFIKVVTMFIVMINVVRSEKRLRAMFWLAFLVGIVLSFNALNDYRQGKFLMGGLRIKGVLGGMFDNPNDMALYLVMMIPLALGLLFVARGISKRLIYGALALLMIAGVVVSFSRANFMALAVALFVMAWKIGRRNRMAVVAMFIVAAALFFIVVPHDYLGRLGTLFGGRDWGGEGSAHAREGLLVRSLLVMLRHPVFGVGMNNFHSVSIREQVSHNAYTQIGAEIGIAALVFYVLFIIASYRRMRQIERETYESRAKERVYYLAVGLQGCLIGYMISSFFVSVAFLWYIYYLVGYALCLHRLYEAKGANGIFRGGAEVRQASSIEEQLGAPPTTTVFTPAAFEQQS
jgi:putative inorganic carbon (hco3(-)) transporter